MGGQSSDGSKRNRCKHGWCEDCKTKRGRNLGNRRERQEIKRMTRHWTLLSGARQLT